MGDTITPALEGGGDVCVEMGKKAGEQRGIRPEEGNRSQIISSTEVYKDWCGGDIRVLIIGGVLIMEY